MKQEFLSFMVECGALKFGDFTLKSGRQSPYFVNAGEMYQDGTQLLQLGKFYADLIKGSGEIGYNVLFGPAYKGIPLATSVAVVLAQEGIKLKVSFDRKERKDHGEGGMIVGYIPQDGDRIAIIEDVTSAGTSVRNTHALLEELGIKAKVTALYISIDRCERGTEGISAIQQIKRDYGIDVYSIATAADIVEYLESSNAVVPNASEYAANMRRYLAEYGAAN